MNSSTKSTSFLTCLTRGAALLTGLLLAGAHLAGCFIGEGGTCEVDVQGEPRDVPSYAGTFDGYAVSLPCWEGSYTPSGGGYIDPTRTLVIVGSGDEWYDGVDPESNEREAALEDLRDELALRIGDDYFLWTQTVDMETENSCYGSQHLIFITADWDQFDLAVDTIGELLREQNLREEIHLKAEVHPDWYCM